MDYFIIKYWCFLIAFVPIKLCQGQDLTAVHFGINSPLQTNIIYDIYFSSDKLLYIATNNGLWIYDGLRFEQKKKMSISSITNIQEDNDKNIYAQDFGGNVYKVINDSLSRLNLEFKVKNYYIKDNYEYYVSSRKYIYIKNRTTHVIDTHTVPNIEIWSSSFCHNIFIGSERPYKNNDLIYFYQLEKGNVVWLEEIEFDSTNIIYKFNEEVLLYKKSTRCIEDAQKNIVVQLPPELTLSVMRKINNSFFVGCKEGLYIPSEGRRFLKGLHVTKILEDTEKNLWVSTVNGGLFKISKINNLLYPKSNLSLRSDFVFVHGKKIITTSLLGDIFYWNKSYFKRFFHSPNKGQIKNIVYDSLHKIYISSGIQKTQFDDSWKIQKTIHKYSTFFYNRKKTFAIKTNYVIQFRADPNFTSDKFKKERGDKKYTKFFLTKRHNKSRTIIFDDKGTKAINKWNDIVLAVVQDTLVYIHTHQGFETKNICYLPNAQKSYVENNRLFITTVKEVLQLDTIGNVIQRIERKNGLEQNISNISVDDNYIAISTKQGIYLLEADNGKHIHKFTNQNGIASIDFDKGWLYQGNLYVNGNKGVSEIPLDGHYNRGNPKLWIEKILVNKVDKGLENSFFEYSQNNIEIFLAVRSYTVQGKIKWKLNDKEWREITGLPVISLSELQYGQYKIKAVFENDLGTKSEEIIYTFTIDAPYWVKWWFWLLIVMSLLTISFIFFKRRIKQMQAKNELEQNLIASQMTALKSQMNPHFIFNALNSIQSLVRFNKNKEAYKYINKFSILLREILNYSDKDFIPLEKEISMLKNYLDMEKMRFDNQLFYAIEINCSLEYDIPSMIIQPFVENSIKHGLLHKIEGKKELTISFELKQSIIHCIITDNGIGRTKAQEIKQQQKKINSSFSTSATQKRLELLQLLQHHELGIKYIDLKDEKGQALGTQVILKIPVD